MYLAIDLGTGSLKCALANSEDYWLEQRPLKLVRGQNGFAEQNPQDWLAALESVLPSLLKRAKLGPERIKAICISSHSPSLLALGERGEVLTPCITWQDQRAEAQAQRLALQTGAKISASFFEPKLIWWKEKRPELYGRTKTFLQPKDYILYQFTGERIMDSCAASLFHWLSESGIDPEKLPRTVNSWEPAGETNRDVSRFGLRSGIPVVAGGIDAYQEALGAGLIEAGQFSDATGTSTCLSLCLGEMGSQPDSVPHVIPGRYLRILPISQSGGALAWFLKNLARGLGYGEIPSVLAKSPPGAEGLLFLPYLAGERSPIWDGGAKGVFFGIKNSHSRSHFLRAVLEGTALAVLDNLQYLRKLGHAPKTARATGGGAQLDVWTQIKADVTGLSYQKLRIKEGALAGGLLLGAHALEKRPFSALIREFIKVERTFWPSDNFEIYAQAFSKYGKLYQATRELMDSEGGISNETGC